MAVIRLRIGEVRKVIKDGKDAQHSNGTFKEAG